MRLQGKVTIVTGGASGIGRAIAERFAREGASVAVVDLDGAGAAAVVESIRAVGGNAVAYTANVAVAADVERTVADTLTAFGGIDILVNNAGTILPKPLEAIAEAEWDRLQSINVKSMYLMIRAAGPHLRARRGNIVNMASLSGLLGQPNNAAYSASKGAVIAMTRASALDYAPHGVRVNCICPAGVMTPLMEKWISQQADPAATRRALDATHPLGYTAPPEEIASAALFLASEDARFVTGVALPVDGGASLGY